MAFQRKPLSELSPAYRARIERAEAKGFTRSQARGHAKSTELPITIVKLAEKSDNSQYLLKKIAELKKPELTKQYLALQKQINKTNKLKKGSKAHDREAKKRDEMARKLAGDIRATQDDTGRDLYAVPNWKPSTKLEPEELEDLMEFDLEDFDLDEDEDEDY